MGIDAAKAKMLAKPTITFEPEVSTAFDKSLLQLTGNVCGVVFKGRFAGEQTSIFLAFDDSLGFYTAVITIDDRGKEGLMSKWREMMGKLRDRYGDPDDRQFDLPAPYDTQNLTQEEVFRSGKGVTARFLGVLGWKQHHV